jgi:predicted transcriptional regulator
MDPQSVNLLLTAKIVGSYLRHHTVGAGELPKLITTVHRSLGQLGRQAPVEQCSPPLSRCANLCVTTTWFVWNAGIGGKPYAATLAPDTD